ncbi:MAG: zinc-ribbon and DUF3426 domain-containing protein [Gammaproteobacteria bacterium]|nr:zinc-ribbon and DUF3426 domain-containing protein [Gammaproteobacteria bacterium]
MKTATTCCPFCQAQIKVSARLIGATGPAVRCGACFRLFTAANAVNLGSDLDPGQREGDRANAEGSTEAVRMRALNTDYSLLSGEGLEPINSAQLPHLDSSPIEIAAKADGTWRHAAKTATSVFTLLLLVAALAAQYLWANRNLYQHSPALYPLFASGCALFNCSIPPFSDISAFRGEALTVVSGPVGSNSLVVSFVLSNLAPLAQTAPVLILSFDTAAQRSVALREFAPVDYFPASTDPIKALGAGERVTIKLELIDPGADAVNYTVAFRAL